MKLALGTRRDARNVLELEKIYQRINLCGNVKNLFGLRLVEAFCSILVYCRHSYKGLARYHSLMYCLKKAHGYCHYCWMSPRHSNKVNEQETDYADYRSVANVTILTFFSLNIKYSTC